MAAWIISAIVLVACFARILPHLNAMPIVALALFTGAYLPDRRSAFLVFFGGLFVSDAARGLHSMIPVVYGALVPVLFLGLALKKKLRAATVAGATLSASLIYFFLTNLGVWVLGGCDWTRAREYPLSLAGLAGAFSAALPGLPEKILADLLASAVFFGVFPLAYGSFARAFETGAAPIESIRGRDGKSS
jgi:hypothetical protein